MSAKLPDRIGHPFYSNFRRIPTVVDLDVVVVRVTVVLEVDVVLVVGVLVVVALLVDVALLDVLVDSVDDVIDCV